MKKVTIILTGVILMTIASVSVKAQATATATAESSATIVATLEIAKSSDLNFGNLAVTETAGTVVMSPNSAGTRTREGGVSLPVVNGTVSAAEFTVTGQSGYAYSISLPTSILLSGDGADMTVDSFTTDKTDNTSALNGTTDSFYVGAKIHVNAGQTPGLYTNEDGLSVTVNYN
jgi:spore coat protein U-like protein